MEKKQTIREERGASFRVVSIDRGRVEARGGELRVVPDGVELMIPECHRPEEFASLVEILKRDFGLDYRGVDSAIEHILEEQTMLWVRDMVRDSRGVDSAIEHILDKQTMLWVRDMVRDSR